jgi:hypothetical protein
MCGIVVYFGGAGNNLTRILTAMSSIIYRAPDSCGVGFFGDDRNPVRARKSLGSVVQLIPVLLADPAYPNSAAEMLSFLIPQSDGMAAGDLQRRLLEHEGFSSEILDAFLSGQRPYPTFDDLVELEPSKAGCIFPGFPGRAEMPSDLYIRSPGELPPMIFRRSSSRLSSETPCRQLSPANRPKEI